MDYSNQDPKKPLVVRETRVARLSDATKRETVLYWQSLPAEDRINAILEIRDFYYKEIKPGSGAERLDRSVIGTRRLRD